jgi:hypothetical protein
MSNVIAAIYLIAFPSPILSSILIAYLKFPDTMSIKGTEA